MSATKAVFLDAGGVLVLPDAEVIVEELRGVGIEIDAARTTRAHYVGMHAVDRAEKFSWWEYNHAYVDAIGITGHDVETARKAVDRAFARMEWHLPIVESMNALAELEERVKVAVVSNSDGTVEDILRRRHVKIPTIIDSHHVGVAKPDPAIFDLAFEAVGVSAGEAVHVGDSIRFDVEGARAAGVRPLHFDPFNVCDASDHEHIRSLRDLVVNLLP